MVKGVVLGFSPRQLEVIRMRTNGIPIGEIAQVLGIPSYKVKYTLGAVYKKVGFSDLALLTRWAMENGLDEPLGPETPEEREVLRPKVFKPRIRLGRLRRAMANAKGS